MSLAHTHAGSPSDIIQGKNVTITPDSSSVNVGNTDAQNTSSRPPTSFTPVSIELSNETPETPKLSLHDLCQKQDRILERIKCRKEKRKIQKETGEIETQKEKETQKTEKTAEKETETPETRKTPETQINTEIKALLEDCKNLELKIYNADLALSKNIIIKTEKETTLEKETQTTEKTDVEDLVEKCRGLVFNINKATGELPEKIKTEKQPTDTTPEKETQTKTDMEHQKKLMTDCRVLSFKLNKVMKD